MFHIQPDQGIELRFHAKNPGPVMFLQKVNMRFDYRDAFEAARGTGYEALLYNCMIGNAIALYAHRFGRGRSPRRKGSPSCCSTPGLQRAHERIPRTIRLGSWGPKAAYALLPAATAASGWRSSTETFWKVPLFEGRRSCLPAKPGP